MTMSAVHGTRMAERPHWQAVWRWFLNFHGLADMKWKIYLRLKQLCLDGVCTGLLSTSISIVTICIRMSAELWYGCPLDVRCNLFPKISPTRTH